MLLDRYKSKIYQSGLKLITYVAIRELFKCDVLFLHSVDKGLYCQIMTEQKLTNDDINRLKAKIDGIIANNYKITHKVVSKKDAYNYYMKNKEAEKAQNIMNLNTKTVSMYELLGYYNYFMGDMPETTGEVSKYGITYLNSNDFVLMTPFTDDLIVPSYNSQEMILKSYSDYNVWCNLVNVKYVSDLNNIVANSKIREYIKKNDIMMDNQLFELANLIRKEGKRVILLGGPSSSGKTTSTKKLALYLSTLGLNPVYLGLDNYFKEREATPKDENGDYDFESLGAIELDLFNNQLKSMLNGEEVSVPTFNFITGKKEYNGNTILMKENDIILIEGLHCLNEELSKEIPYSDKLKIYISPFMPISIDRHNHISTVDIRLIRRIVRDNRCRGYNVIDTLKSWDKVRQGETKYVFPFTNEANVILNTAYTYELGVLRVFAEPLLYSVPIDSKYYNEARRLINELHMFFPIPDDCLSDSNVLREFVGGSYFE